MKYFKLEISEEVISIKYNHPLFTCYKVPSLELPLNKLGYLKLEEGIFSYNICISILGKRKNKILYYNLGNLSKENLHIINAYAEKHINNNS